MSAINSGVFCAGQGASTTTSDPYMALVDEMIEKGSDFSFKGTDDELDTRSSIETSLGYEDLGAAEQDMRTRYMPASHHACCRKLDDLDFALLLVFPTALY